MSQTSTEMTAAAAQKVPFDRSFINFFNYQNFNHGMFILIILSFKDFGKGYLMVEPANMQVYMSVIMMPWSFKIIYGIVSDNTASVGISRRAWIILTGAIQFLSLFILFAFEVKSPLLVAVLLALTSLGEAFTNVASQAMMVIQARRDPQNGQQNLVTLMYVYTAIGGAIGCIFGGYMTENYHPKWCFLCYSFSGLLIILFAYYLSEDSEADVEDNEQSS